MGMNTEQQRGYVEKWRRRKKIRVIFRLYTLTVIIIIITIIIIIIIIMTI